jgi:hypothetical protein
MVVSRWLHYEVNEFVWAHWFGFYLKTEAESSLWKVVLNKSRTMDNVQKRYNCILIYHLHKLLDLIQNVTGTTTVQQNRVWRGGVNKERKKELHFFDVRKGRVIAQAVSRWLPTAAAPFWTRVRSCGICDGESGIGGQVFSEYIGFPCQSSFHRLLHSHHHLSFGAGAIGQ